MHAFTYGASHVAARIAMTKSTRVGSHMRGNVYDNMSKTVHVNSHTRALLLPYIHSHVNSGRTCGFTCGPCGVLGVVALDGFLVGRLDPEHLID